MASAKTSTEIRDHQTSRRSFEYRTERIAKRVNCFIFKFFDRLTNFCHFYSLKQLKDLEYYKFTVKGKFDHSKEIIMQPRTRLDQERPPGGLIGGRNLFNGAWVITPLKLSDRHYSILVNRGWIPKTRIDRKLREESLIEDEVTITGILRLTEKVFFKFDSLLMFEIY